MNVDKKKKTSFGYAYVDEDQKQKLVGEVFSNVAENYDLMNDLMSFGLHRLWKRIAVETSSVRENYTVLDLAGGTGDITKLLRHKVSDKGHLILSDINWSMLIAGRDKLIDEGVFDIDLAQINAESLPFADNTFDLITIAFGLRNVTDKQKVLDSALKALKQRGKLVILEFSRPQNDSFREIYDLFSFEIIPQIGKIVAEDENSYRYLAESIRMHPTQEELKEMLENTSFK